MGGVGAGGGVGARGEKGGRYRGRKAKLSKLKRKHWDGRKVVGQRIPFITSRAANRFVGKAARLLGPAEGREARERGWPASPRSREAAEPRGPPTRAAWRGCEAPWENNNNINQARLGEIFFRRVLGGSLPSSWYRRGPAPGLRPRRVRQPPGQAGKTGRPRSPGLLIKSARRPAFPRSCARRRP